MQIASKGWFSMWNLIWKVIKTELGLWMGLEPLPREVVMKTNVNQTVNENYFMITSDWFRDLDRNSSPFYSVL